MHQKSYDRSQNFFEATGGCWTFFTGYKSRTLQSKTNYKSTVETKSSFNEICDLWNDTKTNGGLERLEEVAQNRKKCRERNSEIYITTKADKNCNN